MALMYQVLMVVCLLVANSSQYPITDYFSQSEINALFMAVSNDIPPRERAPLVRLGFHDCIGPMTGPKPWGVCDGCIDVPNFFNGGIGGSFNLVNRLYAEIEDASRMNFADFLQFCASVAVCLSTDRNRAYKCPLFRENHHDIFQVGRVVSDVHPCPRADDDDFPLGLNGWQKTKDFYIDQFGFTLEEIVDIQAGGHSLGRNHKENSGFIGPWKGNPNKIQGPLWAQASLNAAGLGQGQPWKQVDVGNSEPFGQRPQWQQGGKVFLNSDVSMVKLVDVNDPTQTLGFSQCGGGDDKDLGDCPDNEETLDIVRSVAAERDNDFKNRFYRVWIKMINHGIPPP